VARPWRYEIAGGRYHLTARGNERKPLFYEDVGRFRLLELLAELTERFSARVHAYVLMDNHCHLLVETPEPSLSRVMQWLSVSYSVHTGGDHRRPGNGQG